MTEERRIKLSWETIHTGIESLAYQLTPIKPNLIVGISRGGLIPATLLSHKMSIPLEVISAQSYQGARRLPHKQVEIEGWQDYYTAPRVIFVDDILDTGQTQSAIFGRFRPPHRTSETNRYVTLVNKQPRLLEAIYFCHVPQNVWVEFPWENGDS